MPEENQITWRFNGMILGIETNETETKKEERTGHNNNNNKKGSNNGNQAISLSPKY